MNVVSKRRNGIGDPGWHVDGKSVSQNKTLQRYHGVVMHNPTEVTGGIKSMLLKMLTQLERFLHLAEAVLDHLQGNGESSGVPMPALPQKEPEQSVSPSSRRGMLSSADLQDSQKLAQIRWCQPK